VPLSGVEEVVWSASKGRGYIDIYKVVVKVDFFVN